MAAARIDGRLAGSIVATTMTCHETRNDAEGNQRRQRRRGRTVLVDERPRHR